MIVNEEDALARLNSPDNLVNKMKGVSIHKEEQVEVTDEPTTSNVIIEEMYKNRDVGPRNIPPLIQTLALEHAAVSSNREAAKVFDMSRQNVDYYANGGGAADRKQVANSVATIHSTALDAMLESINLIKPKLKDVKKATDLATIAANLGRMVQKTTPQVQHQNSVKIVVFAPNQKEETQYDEMVVQ